MMKRLLLAAVGVGALASAPAMAANTAIIMWNGADPLGFESATGTGSADLTASDLGGVTVTLSFVSRSTTPNQLTTGQINIDNTTDMVQTLNIIAGANGYLGAEKGFTLTGTIGATSGVSDLSGMYFVDPGNTLNGTNETIIGAGIDSFDSLSLTGPKSFSFNGFGPDLVTGPYGLAERLTLTLQPGASVFVQGASMTASAVPEPKTWAMLVAGFALMGAMAFKRKRTARSICEAAI